MYITHVLLRHIMNISTQIDTREIKKERGH